jgi:WD40 repeat protein
MSNPPLQLLHGKHDSISCMNISPNNSLLLSCSEDGYATTWDLKSSSNNTNQEWKLPKESIGTCCTYEDDNLIFIGTDNGRLLHYDLRMTGNAVKTWNV